MTVTRKRPRPGIYRFSGYGADGAQYSSDMLKLLGVGGSLPAQGLPAILLPGVTRKSGQPVSILTWVEPATGDKRRPHRVRCKCPGCGAELSAGRLFQHVCNRRASDETARRREFERDREFPEGGIDGQPLTELDNQE